MKFHISKDDKWPLIVSLCSLIEILVIAIRQHALYSIWGSTMPDTLSWMNDPLVIRPPFMPLFFKYFCWGYTFENISESFVAIFCPCLIFLISVFLFTRIAIWLGKKFGVLVSLFYGCCPLICFAQFELGSEGFSISFCVITLYAFWRTLLSPSLSNGVLLSVFVLALLTLRPSFLYFPVGLAILALLVIVARQRLTTLPIRRMVTIWVICVAISSAYAMAFSYLVYKRTGVYTLSLVSIWNDCYEIVDAGLLDNSKANDVSGTDPLDHVGQNWLRASKVLDSISPYEIKEFKGMLIRDNRSKWNRYMVNKTITGLDEPLVYSGCDSGLSRGGFHLRIAEIQCSIGLRWWGAIILVLIFGIAGFVWYIALWSCHGKKSREVWATRYWIMTSFLSMIVLGNFLVVVFGAPYDYSRLMFPSLPLVLLLVAAVPKAVVLGIKDK